MLFRSFGEASNVSDLAAGGDPQSSQVVAQVGASTATPVAVASASSPAARAGMIMGAEHQAQGNGVEFAIQAPQSGVELAEEESQSPGDPQPAPTLANGLAGATDFVPDNIDPTVSADPAEQSMLAILMSRWIKPAPLP